MKIYFIEGFPSSNDPNIYHQYISILPWLPTNITKEETDFFSILVMGNVRVTRKGDIEIYIVRQKYNFHTILVLLHELFHFFIHSFWGNNKKIHDSFDRLNFNFSKYILQKRIKNEQEL